MALSYEASSGQISVRTELVCLYNGYDQVSGWPTSAYSGKAICVALSSENLFELALVGELIPKIVISRLSFVARERTGHEKSHSPTAYRSYFRQQAGYEVGGV